MIKNGEGGRETEIAPALRHLQYPLSKALSQEQSSVCPTLVAFCATGGTLNCIDFHLIRTRGEQTGNVRVCVDGT